jgi:hypothetical protein
MAHSKTTFDQPVADAVAKGLSGIPKSLPSWLFYDETGDELFQQIMRMPEYYPTMGADPHRDFPEIRFADDSEINGAKRSTDYRDIP